MRIFTLIVSACLTAAADQTSGTFAIIVSDGTDYKVDYADAKAIAFAVADQTIWTVDDANARANAFATNNTNANSRPKLSPTSPMPEAFEAAARKHLRECGLRILEIRGNRVFSGLAAFLKEVSLNDVTEERRKIAALKPWIRDQKNPARAAFEAAVASLEYDLNEAEHELKTNDLRKRIDAYRVNKVDIESQAEAAYRSMRSPCHSSPNLHGR